MGDRHERSGKSMANELELILDSLRESLSQLGRGGTVVEYDDRGIESRRFTPPLSQVFLLMAAGRRDGFRGNTRPGGQAGSVVDDEGVPMPPLSDPTGELATANIKVIDPIRRHAQRALRSLVEAEGLLRRATFEMVAAFEESDTTAPGGNPVCACHAAAGHYQEAVRPKELPERCEWCYRFRLANNDTDPTPELIRLKERGVRLTERIVSEAMQPTRFARRRKGRGAA